MAGLLIPATRRLMRQQAAAGPEQTAMALAESTTQGGTAESAALAGDGE